MLKKGKCIAISFPIFTEWPCFTRHTERIMFSYRNSYSQNLFKYKKLRKRVRLPVVITVQRRVVVRELARVMHTHLLHILVPTWALLIHA